MIDKRVRFVPAIAVAAFVIVAIWLLGAWDGVRSPRASATPGNSLDDSQTSAHIDSETESLPREEPGGGIPHSTKPPGDVQVLAFGAAYPGLVAAAANGDRTAKVLLAKGLAACADRADLRARYGDMRSRAERLTTIATSINVTDRDREAMDRSILLMDETKARLNAKEEACDGVPESAIKDRWRQQLAAANTGDADMIVDFVTHPAMDPREAFRDDSGIRAYRENAPKLLEQLIHDGDLRGYQAYVRAGYDSLMRRENFRFHDALSRVLKPDPVRVLAYDIALGQSGLAGPFGSGPDHEALRTRQLDSAQRLEAEAMAHQIAPQMAASVSEWLQSHPPGPVGG